MKKAWQNQALKIYDGDYAFLSSTSTEANSSDL